MNRPSISNSISPILFLTIVFVILVPTVAAVGSVLFSSQAVSQRMAILFLKVENREDAAKLVTEIEHVSAVGSAELITPDAAAKDLRSLAGGTSLDSLSGLPYRIRLVPRLMTTTEKLESDISPFLLDPRVDELVVHPKSRSAIWWGVFLGWLALLFLIVAFPIVWTLSSSGLRDEATRQTKTALELFGVAPKTLVRETVVSGALNGFYIGVIASVVTSILFIAVHFYAEALHLDVTRAATAWLFVAIPLITMPLICSFSNFRAIRSL